MWRGLILAKALEQFLTDVKWGELDYLLIDMPPGTGDIQMALSRLLPQAEMLVVTTPAKGAQKVAARVADMARRSYMKVLGVVENMSEFVAPDGSRHAIFGEGGGRRLAKLTGAPLVGRCPSKPAVSEGGDHGRPVVLDAPDAAAATRVHDASHDQIVDRAAPTGRDGRLHRTHVRPREAEAVTREQRTVFGEVAEQYERTRPGYPDELFDTVMRFGELEAGDRALEIGAGTGKATRGFVGAWTRRHRAGAEPRHGRTAASHPRERRRDHVRGLATRRARRSDLCSPRNRGTGSAVRTAPSARHARSGRAGRSRCSGTSRSRSTARSVTRSKPCTPRTGRMSTPSRRSGRSTRRSASSTSSGCFDAVTKYSVDWVQRYSTDEYVALMGTHSNHRILDDAARGRLQRGVGEVIARSRRAGRGDSTAPTCTWRGRRDSAGE